MSGVIQPPGKKLDNNTTRRGEKRKSAVRRAEYRGYTISIEPERDVWCVYVTRMKPELPILCKQPFTFSGPKEKALEAAKRQIDLLLLSR
jgi:hypothetical protein